MSESECPTSANGPGCVGRSDVAVCWPVAWDNARCDRGVFVVVERDLGILGNQRGVGPVTGEDFEKGAQPT